MSIVSFIRSLFVRNPRRQVSAYGSVYSAVVARLYRPGVWVGGTSGYPRVEVHSIIEAERLDKEGQLRQLTLTIDCLSNSSLDEAVSMNDENMTLLTGSPLTIEGWKVVGILPTMLQDLTETTDGHLLYRITQRFDLFVDLVKTDDEEEEAPADETNQEQTS